MTNQGDFVCKICGRECKGKGGLAVHVKNHDPASKAKRAESAHLTFGKRRYKLSDETKRRQSEAAKRRWATKKSGQSTRREAKIEKQYVCFACKRSFNSDADLWTHHFEHEKQILDLWPKNCSICGREYKNARSLAQHIRFHDPNNRQKTSDATKKSMTLDVRKKISKGVLASRTDEWYIEASKRERQKYIDHPEIKEKIAASLRGRTLSVEEKTSRQKRHMLKYGYSCLGICFCLSKDDAISIIEDLTRTLGKKPTAKQLTNYTGLSYQTILNKTSEWGIRTLLMHDKYQASPSEFEILDFVRQIDNSAHKDRKVLCGKEIDIYSDKFHIGIEYDGLYWHSLKFKGVHGNMDKTIACLKEGIWLMHIFEWQWKVSKDEMKVKIAKMFSDKNNDTYATKVHDLHCEGFRIDNAISLSYSRLRSVARELLLDTVICDPMKDDPREFIKAFGSNYQLIDPKPFYIDAKHMSVSREQFDEMTDIVYDSGALLFSVR